MLGSITNQTKLMLGSIIIYAKLMLGSIISFLILLLPGNKIFYHVNCCKVRVG